MNKNIFGLGLMAVSTIIAGVIIRENKVNKNTKEKNKILINRINRVKENRKNKVGA